MQKIDLDRAKQDVLALLDVRAEAEKFGIKFASDTASPSGWLANCNPYKPDTNPSAGFCVGNGPRRGYLVTFNNVGGLREATSFWDLAHDFHPQLFGASFMEILAHYSKKVGIDLSKYRHNGNPKQTPGPPTRADVERFHEEALNRQEVKDHYRTKRGYTDATVKKRRLGYDPKSNRLTNPIWDFGDKSRTIKNIKRYAWKDGQDPKCYGIQGHNEARLAGDEAPDSDLFFLFEGEWDQILFDQITEGNYNSASPTGGVSSFSKFIEKGWEKHLIGKHVVMVADCDAEGRHAALVLQEQLRPYVFRGEIKSFRIVYLFDGEDKSKKDLTDWATKCGGDGIKLIEIVEDTPPIVFKKPDTPLEVKKELKPAESTPETGQNLEGFEFRTTSALLEVRVEVDPIAGPLIHAGEPSIFFGPGGCGKSNALIYLAYHLASPLDSKGNPTNLFGHPAPEMKIFKPRRVVMVQSENSLCNLQSRLDLKFAGNPALAANADNVRWLFCGDDPRTFGDLAGEFRGVIVQGLTKLLSEGFDADAILFDALISYIGDEEENQSTLRSRLIEPLLHVLRPFKITVIFCTHQGLNPGRTRGTTSLVDCVRTSTAVEPFEVKDEDYLFGSNFTHKKSNVGEILSPFKVRWDRNLLPHYFDPEDQLSEGQKEQGKIVLDIVKSHGGKRVSSRDIIQDFCEKTKLKDRSARAAIANCVTRKIIISDKILSSGKRRKLKTYSLPDQEPEPTQKHLNGI